MLIVENGSVVERADSFISLVDARVTALKYGITLPADDGEAEVTIRKAYLLLLQEEKTLQGKRVSANQTGIFPREGVKLNCFDLDENLIPNEVKLAQLYAVEAIQSGASINNVDNGQRLSSFNVDGVYSESYQDGSDTSTNPTIQGVYNQLYPLTKAGLASSGCGFSSGFGELTTNTYGWLG